MAFLFDAGIFSVEGLSGEILPSTKLYWYESGTSTPLATYSNEALTTPNANPVLSDSEGRFPSIWLQDANYKLVMELPNGTQRTRDPIRNPGDGVFVSYTALASTDADKGASIIGTTTGLNVEQRLDPLKTVSDYGAIYSGSDESFAAIAMLAETGILRVPAGKTFVCKNIELQAGAVVAVEGVLKLPANCSDYDRLLFSTNAPGMNIRIREIDGNAANQTGAIGTHLIYFVECDDLELSITYAHDHYISATPATLPDVDSNGRNSSTGAIWLYRCNRPQVSVSLLEGWSREGIYLEECNDAVASLGHAEATLYLEYSGIQIKGARNRLLRASVNNAGASGVGFDTVDGVASNIISTNNRFQHGLNLGHPGFPASRSVINGVVVDGSWENGIQISAGSEDVSLGNIAVRHSGNAGVQLSDSARRGKIQGGVILGSGRWNAVAGVNEILLFGVESSELPVRSLRLNSATGLFGEGETIVGGTSGATGVIAKAIKQRISPTAAPNQRLILESATGTFQVGESVSGSTSGASALIELVVTPTEINEIDGGNVASDLRKVTSGNFTYVKHPDGTAELWGVMVVVQDTAGTAKTETYNYVSTMKWAVAPLVTASINSAASTSAYSVSKLQVSSSTATLTVILNTDSAQTYGVVVYARGRWK